MKCHASPATGLKIKKSSPLPAQPWREGGPAGAASKQGNSHDEYVRDLTDSAVVGMDQISANSMHKVPCFPHFQPQNPFPTL